MEGASSVVEAVENIVSEDDGIPIRSEKRPIMLLLHQLTRNKQHTVITNAKVIEILENEFNISVKTSHELEVDIYTEIIKKFLVRWPQWAELDRLYTKLIKIKDHKAIARVLDHKYKNLKEYLGVMLDIAKPLAKDAVKNLPLKNAMLEAAKPPVKGAVENLQPGSAMLEAAKPLAKDTVKNLPPESATLEAAKPPAKETVKNLPPGSAMLGAAKPPAKETVKTRTPETGKMKEKINPNNIILEIECTKEKLNQLFFRRPRLDLNNTVFNISNVASSPSPSPISLKSLSSKQILYGWCMKISINLPHFLFVREVSYNLKHVLVNKVHYKGFPDTELDTELQTQQRDQSNKNAENCSTDLIIKQFSDILGACETQNYELNAYIHALFNMFISELNNAFDEDYLYKVPARYRKHANKFKYVRYLYTENDQNDDPRYDLQLEETIAPSYNYFIGRLGKIENVPPIFEWLKFECMFCQNKIPINTQSVKVTLEAHFNAMHQNEVDWQCTHCKKTFSIDYLCDNKWFHEC